MAYDSSLKLITAPVSINDLQNCFTLTSDDLRTLLTTANINMWSRHKPMRWTYVAREDIRTSHPTDYNQWWLGEDGDYGIKFSWITYTTTTSVRALFTSSSANYYTKRSLLSIHYARLDDMYDYMHACNYPNISSSFPIACSISTASFYYQGGSITMSVTEGAGDDRLLRLIDVVGEQYIGLVFRVTKSGSSSDEFFFASSGVKMNQLAVQGSGGTTTNTITSGNMTVVTMRTSTTTHALTFAAASGHWSTQSAYNNATVKIIPVLFNGIYGSSASKLIPLYENTTARDSVMKTITLKAAGSADVGYNDPTTEITFVSKSQNSSGAYVLNSVTVKVTPPANFVSTTFRITEVSMLYFQWMEDEKYMRYLTKNFNVLSKAASDNFHSFTMTSASSAKTITISSSEINGAVWCTKMTNEEAGYTPTGNVTNQVLVSVKFSGTTNTSPAVNVTLTASKYYTV